MTHERGGSRESRGEPGHVPVLVEETLALLEIGPGQTVIDGTVGAGGLSERLAEEIGEGGRLIAIDRDPTMLEIARKRLGGRAGVGLYHMSYSEMREAIADAELGRVDRVVLDLGFSSIQIDDPARGLSFQGEGPLDMRYDRTGGGVMAAEIVNTAEELALADLLYRYGGERRSRPVARAIVRARANGPIETTGQLAEIVSRAMPGGRGRSRIHPATRTFQALRIVVNEELSELESGLRVAEHLLGPGGRLAVISFHSLEDGLVKNFFRDGERAGRWQRVTKKPVRPTIEEMRENSRSRSARLRVAERTQEEE